jgi:hypothetical protein
MVWFRWRCNHALEQRTGKPDVDGEMFKIESKTVKLQRQRVEMWSMETVAPAEGGREDSPLWLHSSIIFTVSMA